MNPLFPQLHPRMYQPQWDPAAFGKAFGGFCSPLNPQSGAGRVPLWLSSSLAPSLLR